MPLFEDREKAAEREFVAARERPFKIAARRNKLLGLWAADRMGLRGDEAARYAASLVEAGSAPPGDAKSGDEAIVRKLVEDLAAQGCAVAEAHLLAQLREFAAQAARELGGGDIAFP